MHGVHVNLFTGSELFSYKSRFKGNESNLFDWTGYSLDHKLAHKWSTDIRAKMSKTQGQLFKQYCFDYLVVNGQWEQIRLYWIRSNRTFHEREKLLVFNMSTKIVSVEFLDTFSLSILWFSTDVFWLSLQLYTSSYSIRFI